MGTSRVAGVRSLSLTHIAQVRSSWTINNPVNAKLRPGLAKVLEETPPIAEQHGCQGDFELVHDTHVLEYARHRSVKCKLDTRLAFVEIENRLRKGCRSFLGGVVAYVIQHSPLIRPGKELRMSFG